MSGIVWTVTEDVVSGEREAVFSPSLRGGLFYLLFYGQLAVYLPFLSVYFQHLGLSGWQIGLLAAVVPSLAFVLIPPLTLVADRTRRRRSMLAVASLGCGLTLLLLYLPRSFLALLPFMVLLAIFRSPLIPLSDSMIARMASRHGLNFGGMRLWGSLGFAVMSIGCGWLWQRFGYRPMFITAGLLLIPVAVIALTMEEGPVVARHARTSIRTIRRDTILVTLLVATFLMGGAIFMDLTFVGIYMVHVGGSNFLVGMLFGIAAVSELPSMRFSGVLAKWLGDTRTLLLSYGLLGVAYIGYAAIPHPQALLAFSVLRGMGYGLFYVSTVRVITERTPPEWSATVQGTMNATAFGLAQLISGPIGGRIYDTAGPVAVYVTCASVVGVAILVLGTVSATRF